jgi:mannitol/fructose-specific phosphotransferase system IIA component (Ntr-type)
MKQCELMQLSDLLAAGGIELNLKSGTRDEVLRELAGMVPGLSDGSRNLFCQALLDREALCSTGIGDGMALPHARNPQSNLIQQPAIIFGRHPTGIDYQAVDHAPVRLFFLLTATNVSQHLFILARISRMLRRPGLRQLLLTADTPAQVLEGLRTVEATAAG